MNVKKLINKINKSISNSINEVYLTDKENKELHDRIEDLHNYGKSMALWGILSKSLYNPTDLNKVITGIEGYRSRINQRCDMTISLVKSIFSK